MKYRLIGAALLITLLSTSLPAQQRLPSKAATQGPTQGFDSRFKLYPTQNVWTFLLLDSNNGRVWQVHFAVTAKEFSGRLPINEDDLVAAGSAHPGRFALWETQNVYTFLLLDQDDGRVWQLQRSNDKENRGLIRVLSTESP